MIRFILMVLAILAIPILLFAGSDAMAAAGLPAPNPYMTMGTVLLGGLIKRGVKKMGLSSKTMPWLNLGATLIHTGITVASPGLGGFVGQAMNQFFNNWGGHKALKGLTSFGTGGKFRF